MSDTLFEYRIIFIAVFSTAAIGIPFGYFAASRFLKGRPFLFFPNSESFFSNRFIRFVHQDFVPLGLLFVFIIGVLSPFSISNAIVYPLIVIASLLFCSYSFSEFLREGKDLAIRRCPEKAATSQLILEYSSFRKTNISYIRRFLSWNREQGNWPLPLVAMVVLVFLAAVLTIAFNSIDYKETDTITIPEGESYIHNFTDTTTSTYEISFTEQNRKSVELMYLLS